MQKRSVCIAGHQTSLSLEPEFWVELKRIAAERHLSLNQLVGQVDRRRKGNLSSALRIFVLLAIKAEKEKIAPRPDL